MSRKRKIRTLQLEDEDDAQDLIFWILEEKKLPENTVQA